MLKALFWFCVGTLATVVFAVAMLFIFGQSNRVTCRHPEPKLTSCSVSSLVMGLIPLPGWKLDGVVKAEVEEDCNDGCTYRTALVTGGGQSRPVSEVWTDQRYQDEQMAAQISDFIQAGDVPELVINNQPAAWVIWLLVGLAVMSIAIQCIVFFAQVVPSLFSSRPSGGGALR